MPTKSKQKFYLDVHDFGFLLPGLDDLLRLKAIYPDFKITCFTIPFPKEFFVPENVKHFKVEKYKKWAKVINGYDWIEIGIHGFAHTHHEMDNTSEKAKLLLDATENLFKEIGLEYKKIFCAPFWQYSYSAIQELYKRDYVIALDRNGVQPTPKDAKKYIYNWSFDQPILPPVEKVLGHGHLQHHGVTNSIKQTYRNIINLIPSDAEFGFISELYEEGGKVKGQAYGNSKNNSGERTESSRKGQD